MARQEESSKVAASRKFLGQNESLLAFDPEMTAVMGATIESITLDQIAPGKRVILRALPRNRELQSRLMLLGLFIGSAADVVQTRRRGPTLIRVRNSLVAIGFEEAKTILVDVPK
jgi:Fe2+ transport system protein FeoA